MGNGKKNVTRKEKQWKITLPALKALGCYASLCSLGRKAVAYWILQIGETLASPASGTMAYPYEACV